jgi:hypothetical protein
MFSSTVFFDTDMPIQSQLIMFQPLLTSWIGGDYLNYYNPLIDYFSFRPGDGNFLIVIEANVKYQQGIYDNDNFPYMLSIIDLKDKYAYQENLDKIIAALELLWANKIPTCTPGKEDILPYEGGETGPIPWP